MISTIIVAWILTWFNLDETIVSGINQIFNTDYTVAVYWLIFCIVGIIACIISKIRD